MRFTILVIATGLVIAVLTGGRLRFLAERTLRFWPLLWAGLAVQAASVLLGGSAGLVLLVGSYALLLAFAAANVDMVGMWLVATGIALNLVVIAVNGGMPVRASALVAAGAAAPGSPEELNLGHKHHIERPSDRLVVLGDIIPVAPLREVLSFGDVVMAVGAADVIAHMLRPASRRRTGAASRGRARLGAGRAGV